MACRNLLLKLQKQKLLTLPAPKKANNDKKNSSTRSVSHSSLPISASLKDLPPLQIKPVGDRDGLDLFKCFLLAYHYLGFSGHVGENLKYMAYEASGRPLACLLFGSSAWACGPGDDFIGCGRSLEDISADGYIKRQVFDLPPIEIEVTEHRAQQKRCPQCGQLNRAHFPKMLDQPTQYGPRIKAYAVYLNQYQLLPFDRIRELFLDPFGTTFSAGTIVNANWTCCAALRPVEEAIKDKITACPFVYFDETGPYTGKTDGGCM